MYVRLNRFGQIRDKIVKSVTLSYNQHLLFASAPRKARKQLACSARVDELSPSAKYTVPQPPPAS